MTDSKQNLSTWPRIKTEFRKWTEKEVLDAVNYIKKERPQVWQELIEEELAEEPDDLLAKSEASGRVYGIITRLHPESDLTDNGNLFSLIINALRNEIEDGLIDGR